MNNELVTVDMSQYGLEETKAAEIRKDFDAVLKIAIELEVDFNEIIATDEITPETANKAKAVRLKYVKIRTGIAAIHKSRKAFYLSGGRAVDGLKNAYTHAVQGNEEKLKEIECHFENIEKERLDKMYMKRAEELAECGVELVSEAVRTMDDDVYSAYLTGIKADYKARVDAEEKAEEERIAKAKADREEQARVQKENERLKKEAKDREADDKRVAEEREKERKAADEKLAKERAKRERAEKEMQYKVDAIAKIQADTDAREKDQAHRKRVNNEARQDIVSLAVGVSEDQAKAIVIAIAKGGISNVTINY